ncbi:hypothetical protein [Bernardetia sp. MNP-M8]|uniref:hypothetical protein n=1 Tax=Bernardetia sp. MNP-M8 TaxID=3127470 RepID=UPI0030CB6624
MYYIERNSFYRYTFCNAANNDIAYYAVYNVIEDSLLVRNIYSLEKEFCFVEQGIDWFPPYFVRVKKINYAKFNVPEVKHKYLRDPLHPNSPRYDKKWEDKQKKKAKKEERRKEREQSKNSG